MNRSAQASDWSRADEAAFRAMLAEWLDEFRESLGGAADGRERHLADYVEQEAHYSETVRFLLHELPARPSRALDVGAAAGGFTCALALAGIEAHGIEPMRAGVAAAKLRARRLGASNAHFHDGVGEHLPFADASFDLVVSAAVLEHVENQAAVLREIHRVLKPGGYFYVEVPNYLYPFEPHYKIAWLPMMPKSLGRLYVRLRGFRPEFLDHLIYTNGPRLLGLLRAAGFNECRSCAGRRLAAKFVGAAWTPPSPSAARLPAGLRRVAARLLSIPGPDLFLHRAVIVLARKPVSPA
jgi:SAM-dependent methyltransferase